MKEKKMEAKELVSPEGLTDLEIDFEAVRRRLHEYPVLTIHPKVNSKISQNDYETRCMLNTTALEAIFEGQAKNLSLNFGNKKRLYLNRKEGEKGYYGIRSEVCITNTNKEIRGGIKASRFKVTLETGLIEGENLAGMIFHMHEGLGEMSDDTIYHFLLLPYTETKKNGYILEGWELHLVQTESAKPISLTWEKTNNMKEFNVESMITASPEERKLIYKQVRAIIDQPEIAPLLTIHPKVRINGSKEPCETRCILNPKAMEKIFESDEEKYELDFGQKTRAYLEWDEEVKDYRIHKINEIMFIVAQGEPQKGKSMARMKVNPETGLIESDLLATIIGHYEKSISSMDEDFMYQYLLMPSECDMQQNQEVSKKGWEMRLLKEEPAQELILKQEETIKTKN